MSKSFDLRFFRQPKLQRVLSRIAAARPLDAPPWRLARDLARSSSFALASQERRRTPWPLAKSKPRSGNASHPPKLAYRGMYKTLVSDTHLNLQVPIFYLQPQVPKIVFFYLATSMRRRAPAVWRPGYQHSHTESSNKKVFRTKTTKGKPHAQVEEPRQGAKEKKASLGDWDNIKRGRD